MTNRRIMGFIKAPFRSQRSSGHIKILILLAGVKISGGRSRWIGYNEFESVLLEGGYGSSTFIPKLCATNDHSSAV